jgi:hypothetical protein
VAVLSPTRATERGLLPLEVDIPAKAASPPFHPYGFPSILSGRHKTTAQRTNSMNFRVTAYVASGEHEALSGTVEYYRSSAAECIGMLNDLTSIPLPPGDWGEQPRIVGAEYRQRDGDAWRLIDSSETLAKHMDWSPRPRRGQPD